MPGITNIHTLSAKFNKTRSHFGSRSEEGQVDRKSYQKSSTFTCAQASLGSYKHFQFGYL